MIISLSIWAWQCILQFQLSEWPETNNSKRGWQFHLVRLHQRTIILTYKVSSEKLKSKDSIYKSIWDILMKLVFLKNTQNGSCSNGDTQPLSMWLTRHPMSLWYVNTSSINNILTIIGNWRPTQLPDQGPKII